MFEDVEPSAGDRAGFEQADQLLLVDDLAARGVDEDRMRRSSRRRRRRRADKRW